jgi:hypothetical protein
MTTVSQSPTPATEKLTHPCDHFGRINQYAFLEELGEKTEKKPYGSNVLHGHTPNWFRDVFHHLEDHYSPRAFDHIGTIQGTEKFVAQPYNTPDIPERLKEIVTRYWLHMYVEPTSVYAADCASWTIVLEPTPATYAITRSVLKHLIETNMPALSPAEVEARLAVC